MENNTLTASVRTSRGKGSARQSRLKGELPGVFYYRGQETISLKIDQAKFDGLMRHKPSLILLKIEDQEARECIIREIQLDPVTDRILHVDLLGIKRGQKLKVTVSVRLTGIPTGVRSDGGLLQYGVTEVNIECLPKDIPRAIEVDVTMLKIGDTIHLSDLDYPEFKFLDELQVLLAQVVEPVVAREEEEEEEEEVEEEAEEGETSEKSSEKSESKT